MKKRAAALLMALMLIFSISVFALADNVATEARNSVAVLVTVADVDGQTKLYGLGTCFFVGEEGQNPKYMLTNHHVVEDYLTLGEGETVSIKDDYGMRHNVKMSLRVYFSSDDYEEAYVVASDENQDSAILKLSKPTDKRVPLKLRVPTNEMVGEEVYTVGYPTITDNTVLDPKSVWSNEDSLVTKATIGRLTTKSGSGTQWIQTADTEWSAGNSGSPLIYNDGSAIGFVSGLLEDDGDKLYYAVDIDPVIDMLKANGVAYTIATDEKEVEEPVVEVVEEPVEEEPAFPWWIIAVAAAVVIALVVILVVVNNNKKKKKLEEEKKAEEAKKANVLPKEKKAVPSVRSLSPQHNGKKATIKDKPVTIGRSPECNIVFQSSTPGVSGNHCSVSWDNTTKDFVIIDVGSTYGTFLESGQKLTAKTAYHIKAGDSFYLGEKENMLRVELD